MEVRLPDDKLLKARTLPRSFMARHKVTLREIQSLSHSHTFQKVKITLTCQNYATFRSHYVIELTVVIVQNCNEALLHLSSDLSSEVTRQDSLRTAATT